MSFDASLLTGASVPTAASGDGGGSGLGTLAAIYTAGLADEANDNLFPMASGNLRFWGDTASESFPAAAFFESSTTPGDSRVAAWFTRRYYQTALSIGDVSGDTFMGFDPAWGGGFSALNDFTFTTTRVAFTNSTDETTNPSGISVLQLGTEIWAANEGFFDGPACYPTPGNNPGGRTLWRLDLYNSVAADISTAYEVTGWGQSFHYLQPVGQGITAGVWLAPNWGGVSAAPTPLNGSGVFIGNGKGDPPRAIYEAHMLDNTVPGGAYGLGFWVASGAGTINQIATMDWTAGVVFNAPVSGTNSPSNSLVVQPSDNTSISVTGLVGDTASVVEIWGDVIYKGGSGSTTYLATLVGPAAASLTSYIQYNNGSGVLVGSAGASPVTNGWWLGASNSSSDTHIVFKLTITTHTGRLRSFFATGTTAGTSGFIAWTSWGWCTDTTTPITGVTITGTVASTIRANSYLLTQSKNMAL